MELTMDAQEDATPWPEPASSTAESTLEGLEINELHGRGYFSQLEIVRRKPCEEPLSNLNTAK